MFATQPHLRGPGDRPHGTQDAGLLEGLSAVALGKVHIQRQDLFTLLEVTGGLGTH